MSHWTIIIIGMPNCCLYNSGGAGGGGGRVLNAELAYSLTSSVDQLVALLRSHAPSLNTISNVDSETRNVRARR